MVLAARQLNRGVKINPPTSYGGINRVWKDDGSGNGFFGQVDWSELANKPTFGSASVKNIDFFLNTSNNLSDLPNPSTARSNLGLATVASTGAFTDLVGAPNMSLYALLSGATFSGNIAASNLSNTNTGDVTLAGTPNYITRVGQVLTLNAIDLSSTNATGTLAAARAPAFNGGDVTSTAGSLALTLNNVNSNVGTFNSVTVNSKGLVTSASNVSVQAPITLTTTGNSGAATFVSNVLNIPQYTTYSNGTGLSLVSGVFSVNSSQAISQLSNLTSNGFIKTSGSNGTLSVDTNTYINTTQLGVASGVATLDSGGKLTNSQIPASLLGALNYQGTWNASTNVPVLSDLSVAPKGYYWKVSTAGSTSLGGITTWNVGDIVVSNGTTYDKVDGVASEVLSVAGRTGIVTLAVSDVSGALSTVTVASSNGFTGTSSGGTTPVLTIATSVTGVLKGNGTVISAAVAGTDYIAPYTSQTQNYFLASPNGSSGLPTFRAILPADVPTLNQSTTGSAGSVAASGITGATLASNVLNSSLTGLGTVTVGTWNATKVGLAYGGTNTDLSATGGTSQVLMQMTAGGNIQVRLLSASDLSSVSAYSYLGNSTGSTASPAANTALILGTTAPFSTTAGEVAAQFTSNYAGFYQVAVQNTSNNAAASSDFVVTADIGTDTTHYTNWGKNSSGGGSAPFTNALAAYLYDTDNELNIGATGSTGVVNFYTTGGTSPVKAGYFDANQYLNLLGQLNLSVAGAASSPGLVVSGTPFAGTGITSFPQLYLNQSTATPSTTLNTAGTFLGINSHGSQDFINCMKDGTNQFKVDSAGKVTLGNVYITGSSATFSSFFAAQFTLSLGNGLSGFYAPGTNGMQIGTGGDGVVQIGNSIDMTARNVTLYIPANNNLQFGNKDAASPSAQKLSVQNVLAGGSNDIAGQLWTLSDSIGVGAGASGGFAFVVHPAGTSGNTQNASFTALTIDSGKTLTLGDGVNFVVNSTTGSKIGTATTQKIGFFGKTPIAQPSGDIATALANLGLMAASPTLAASSLTGATVSGTNTGDQNIFSSVVVSGQTTITTGSTSQALTFVAGTGVTLTTDNTAKSITITASGGGGGANTALSNLASVAINTALIPSSAGGLDFGSTSFPWASIWLAGTSGTPGTNQFKITGVSTSGVRTITLPDASGTVALIGVANTFSASNTFSAAGAASTAGVIYTGTPYAPASTGTATNMVPLVYINAGTAPSSWNSTATTGGTQFGINSASGFTGNMIDCHVNGGASVFTVSYNGSVTLPSGAILSMNGASINSGSFGSSRIPSGSQSPFTHTGTLGSSALTGATNFPIVFMNTSGNTAVTNWSNGTNNGTYFGIDALSSFTGNFIDCHASSNTSLFTVNSAGAITAGTISAAQITSGTMPSGVGVSSTSYSQGTMSSGTYTINPANGNFQHVTNNGAHTLAPPASNCSNVIIEYTNQSSAGAITTSGFTIVKGDTYNTTNANKFIFTVTKTNSYSLLTITALQ